MNELLLNGLRLVVLVLLQVFLLDNIHLFGYITPVVYILFVFLFPVENNRMLFLITAFMLGLIIDTFHDTGGAHAIATLTLSYSRPLLFRLVYGEGYRTKNLKIIQSPLDRFMLLTGIGVFIHHLILFSLILFDSSQAFYVLKWSLTTSIASFLIITIIFMLFSNSKRV